MALFSYGLSVHITLIWTLEIGVSVYILAFTRSFSKLSFGLSFFFHTRSNEPPICRRRHFSQIRFLVFEIPPIDCTHKFEEDEEVAWMCVRRLRESKQNFSFVLSLEVCWATPGNGKEIYISPGHTTKSFHTVLGD